MFLFAIVKEGSIGGADIRIVFGLGLMVGVYSILRIYIFSTIIAFFVTVIILLDHKQKLTCTKKIPYVPFVLGGYAVEIVLCLIA
jgi:Flp pilus assembly protein protease CpaA